MIFYINLNIWKFYYKNNWNFLSFKQSLIKQNFQFLIPLFLKTIDRTWNETKSKKDSKRKKIVRKSKDPLQPRLKSRNQRHVASRLVWSVAEDVAMIVLTTTKAKAVKRKREREKRKEEEKKHGPFSRQLLWKWTACVRKRTVTYPRGDARVNPYISPVTLLGMRLSKVAAKVQRKRKEAAVSLFVGGWSSPQRRRCRATSHLWVSGWRTLWNLRRERDLCLVNQPTAIYKI